MTRHRFDPLSFLFGVLFVAVAALGLLDRDLLAVTDLRWIAPGLLVLIGALLLVFSGRTGDADEAHDRDVSGGRAGRDDPAGGAMEREAALVDAQPAADEASESRDDPSDARPDDSGADPLDDEAHER